MLIALNYLKKLDLKKVMPLVIVVFVWLVFKNTFKSAYTWVMSRLRATNSRLTDEQASNIAETLKEAFNNWIPYNSFAIVKQELKNITLSDYYKIKASFGTVARGVTGEPVTDWSSMFFMDKTLGEWLKLELTEKQQNELKELNPIFKSIL